VTTFQAELASTERAAGDYFAVKIGAELWCSLLRGEVDIVNADAVGAAVGPWSSIRLQPLFIKFEGLPADFGCRCEL
jgi:hypothetical protein